MSGVSSGLPRLSWRSDKVDQYTLFSRCATRAADGEIPIVMVHGLSMSSKYWVPAARRLAKNYHVYAPDFPGYGKSQRPDHTLTISQLADVLEAWMDQIGLESAYLLGNSMGCQVIAEFAARAPGRVPKAVLVGPTMDPNTESIPKLFLRGFVNMLFEPVSFYPVLMQDYARAGIQETFQALEDAMQDPIQKNLRAVPMPVLVVRGAHDWLVTQPWVQRVSAILPKGQLLVIPGGAHVAHYDQADAFTAAVLRFFQDRD